jgi:hypothetical protein
MRREAAGIVEPVMLCTTVDTLFRLAALDGDKTP